MIDLLQNLINWIITIIESVFWGFCAGIGFGISEIYVRPWIVERRALKYLKDKFVELKDLKKEV